MVKLMSCLAAGYLGVVVLSKGLERRGRLRCDCAHDCWCHRPGLSLLRWTFPVGHTAGSDRTG